MACALFVEDRLCRCSGVQGLLIPSVYERERFCRPEGGHKSCPTFCAYTARGTKLPQEVYYALWLPIAEGSDSPADEEPSALPMEHGSPIV